MMVLCPFGGSHHVHCDRPAGPGHARAHHAAGVRLLGVEDPVERGRAGGVHRAGRRPARRRSAGGPARPASARRPRLPRRAGGAARPGPDRWRLRQHRRDRSLSRPRQALLCRRHPGDGQPAALSLLGGPDRGAAHRPAAERGQGGRRPLRRDLCQPRGPRRVPQRHDRRQPAGGACARRPLPLGRLSQRHRHRRRGGVDAGRAGPRPSASRGGRLRPAAGAAGVRGLCGAARPGRPGALPRRRLHARADALGRGAGDGPHPPRLGPGAEADAGGQGPCGAAAGRGADRL